MIWTVLCSFSYESLLHHSKKQLNQTRGMRAVLHQKGSAIIFVELKNSKTTTKMPCVSNSPKPAKI